MPIRDETELDDFMVEIDILSECKHPHIVGLLEAYSFDSALWVNSILYVHVHVPIQFQSDKPCVSYSRCSLSFVRVELWMISLLVSLCHSVHTFVCVQYVLHMHCYQW